MHLFNNVGKAFEASEPALQAVWPDYNQGPKKMAPCGVPPQHGSPALAGVSVTHVGWCLGIWSFTITAEAGLGIDSIWQRSRWF